MLFTKKEPRKSRNRIDGESSQVQKVWMFWTDLAASEFLFCHACWWCFPFYRVCRRRTLSARQVPSKTSELSGPGYFRNLEIGFRGRRDRTILIHHAHQKSSENWNSWCVETHCLDSEMCFRHLLRVPFSSFCGSWVAILHHNLDISGSRQIMAYEIRTNIYGWVALESPPKSTIVFYMHV